MVEETQELPTSPLAKKIDADSVTTGIDRINNGMPSKRNRTAPTSPNSTHKPK